MRASNVQRAENLSVWLENQYCASVAATLLARTEYFELLEDAMVPQDRLVRALSAWRQCASKTHVLGGSIRQRMARPTTPQGDD
jgi:hypothetical protein